MNSFTPSLTDPLVATEVFTRIEQRRKHMGISQTVLSERIGVTPKTYRSIKVGSCNLMTFLMVLRELHMLENLEALLPVESVRPSDILKQEAQSHSRTTQNTLNQTRSNTGVAETLLSRKQYK